MLRILKNKKPLLAAILLPGILLLLSVTHSFAQITKGSYIIGGNADGSLSYNGTTHNFNVSLQPTFAVFVVNNFAIGPVYAIGISGTHTLSATNVPKQTNSFTTSLGPYVKYYIGKKALKGTIAASAAYAISSGLRTETNRSPAQAYTGFSVGGTVGLAYFFNPHISLEPGLFINTTGYETQIPTTRFGFTLGLFIVLEKAKVKPVTVVPAAK